MSAIVADVRFALRRLARAPGFALVTATLLAFAFMANACVFSEVWCLLYQPLPFAQAEQLVSVDMHWIKENQDNPMRPATLQDIAGNARTLAQIAGLAHDWLWLDNGPDADPTAIESYFFQPQLFDVLGLQPLAGRAPTVDDARVGDPANVLVSPRFALERFGGIEPALGQTLRTKEGTLRVIGVMPRNAPFAGGATVWRPLMFAAQDSDLYPEMMRQGVRGIGRLVEGATRADAQRELIALQPELPSMQQFADKLGVRLRVNALRELWMQEDGTALHLMLLVVLMIFVITAINTCNLYIARLSQQGHETALLTALGAGPSRRVRLVLIETLTLTIASASIGLALVPLGFKLLAHFDLLPEEAPYPIDTDTMRIAFVGLLALVLTCALTLSALWLQRKQGRIYETLKQGGARQTAGVTAQRARVILTVAQVALTTALLVGTGLLLRSAQKLLDEDLGFDREHLVVTGLSFEGADTATYYATLRALRERVAAMPGVASAALGSLPPLFRERPMLKSYQPPDDTETDDTRWPAANFNFADTDYFTTLGQPLIAGRAFTPDETHSAAPVAIVDRDFVKRHFANVDAALGRRFKVFAPWQSDQTPAERELTIVGVVGSVKMFAPDQTVERPSIYVPTDEGYSFIIRTRIAPASLEASLKQTVHDIAPTARLGAFDVMSERLDDIVQTRFRLNALLEGLGVLALVLAAVGLYAVLAYSVRMRTSEFGVKLALGAPPARVTRDVLAQGLRLVAIGLALGMPLAYATAQVLAAQLYQVSPFDPLTLVIVGAAVAAIGFVASWRPARHAARVDPIIALRQE